MRGRLLNNRYRLGERIGAGGMGEVWRARDEALGRTVAVKVFKPSGEAADSAADRGELLARFRQEARAAATLDSPRIIAVHDYGTDRDVPYLVMALVNGRSLEQVLRDEGRLPLERTLRWTEQVCEALAVAHDAGVVHRDIKPGNVMITDDGSAHGAVKVLDFGIAKFLEADDSSNRLTRTGAMPIGSVLYMAPEQFRQDDAVDGRLDLYALGCVLYELLVGRPPYTGPAAGIMYNHLHDTPLRPSLARSELTPAVDQLVLGLMAKEPAGRPADAREAAERVRTVRTGLAGAGAELEPSSGGPPEARSVPPAQPVPPVASAEPEATAGGDPVLPLFSPDELLEQPKPSGELVKPAKASLSELAAAADGSRAVDAQVIEDRVPEGPANPRRGGRFPQLRKNRVALTTAAAVAGVGVLATVIVGVGGFDKEATYQIGVTDDGVHEALSHVLDHSDVDPDRFDLVTVSDTSSWEAVTQRHPDLVALIGNPRSEKSSKVLPVLRTHPNESDNSNEQSRDRTIVYNTEEQATRLLRYLSTEHDLSRLLLLERRNSTEFATALTSHAEWEDVELTRAVHGEGEDQEMGTVDREYVRELARGKDAPQVAILPDEEQRYGAQELREDGFEGLIVTPEPHSFYEMGIGGFGGPTKLPEDVVRVRAYADPAKSPSCDDRESWCSGRGALPDEPGVWEEYDAARALVAALAEINLDQVAPQAREELDKALAEVKTEGLIGTVDFGTHGSLGDTPHNRPIWLDRTENGRWKEAELLR